MSGVKLIKLTVDGGEVEAECPANATLFDLLREKGLLGGEMEGCDDGACQACAVLVDGEEVLSCLTLAWAVEGKAVGLPGGMAGPGQGRAK